MSLDAKSCLSEELHYAYQLLVSNSVHKGRANVMKIVFVNIR